MVAVSEVGATHGPPDVDPLLVPVPARRLVAVAATAMELLRPASDLYRVIEGFPHVDLLICAEDGRPGTSPVGLLAPDRTDPGPDPAVVDDDADDDDADDDDDDDELVAAVAGLGHSGLHLHRLGLPARLLPLAEADLVGALSELVGFDPEPGVQCLAPASRTGDPARSAVDRAVQRIARVYGLPLLRYRCLELTVVVDGADGAGPGDRAG